MWAPVEGREEMFGERPHVSKRTPLPPINVIFSWLIKESHKTAAHVSNFFFNIRFFYSPSNCDKNNRTEKMLFWKSLPIWIHKFQTILEQINFTIISDNICASFCALKTFQISILYFRMQFWSNEFLLVSLTPLFSQLKSVSAGNVFWMSQ